MLSAAPVPLIRHKAAAERSLARRQIFEVFGSADAAKSVERHLGVADPESAT